MVVCVLCWTCPGDAGDRTFSKWGGSVLDSVVGVFLTQNVSDFLSRYDLKTRITEARVWSNFASTIELLVCI